MEVLEEKEVKLLVQSGYSVDWEETAENEDHAILWAVRNDKFGILDILSLVIKLNLQGDPSADLAINCGSETFRVHRNLLCYRSPVFRVMLDSPMREAREGEINIQEMDPATLSSMIHYIYTLELAGDWQDLDILDVVRAADMYDLPGWLELFWYNLRTGDITLSEEKMAEISRAGDTYSNIFRNIDF